MEEGRREAIVRICRTTEDRRGQEPLFALRPLLQANCFERQARVGDRET